MPANVLMPALSPTMESGKLIKWLIKEGEEVKAGDVIAEIETDKAVMELEAVEDGRLGKILVPGDSEDVAVNTPIAVLLLDNEDETVLDGYEVKPVSKATVAVQETVAQPHTPVVVPSSVSASPLARRLAQKYEVPLETVRGSGPRGRIVKSDVEAARGTTKRMLLPDARLYFSSESYTEQPLTPMRKSIAGRLTLSKQEIPHYTLQVDCRVDALMQMRKVFNGTGGKISVNDFIVRAVALALMEVPEVNASWGGDAILQHKSADIGVAVALEGGGLVTPLVRGAEHLGIKEISSRVKDLAHRAQERKLKPEEYEGGTFSISNLGMFGIKSFTAVINPPQSAIMAVGAALDSVVVQKDKTVPATVMSVTLSCDHRVIDGAVGARFLQVFKKFIENPESLR